MAATTSDNRRAGGLTDLFRFSVAGQRKRSHSDEHDGQFISAALCWIQQSGYGRRLLLLTDDVAWANGMEGTHVFGKDAIREYWTHQWSVINPHVEPLKMTRTSDGYLIVDVHQVVKNLDGQTLIDETVKHAFRLECGRVKRFDIQSDTQLTGIHSKA